MPQFSDNNDQQFTSVNRGTKAISRLSVKGTDTARVPSATSMKPNTPQVATMQPADVDPLNNLQAAIDLELNQAVAQRGGVPASQVTQEQMPAPMRAQTGSPSSAHTAIAVEDLPSKGLFYHEITHIHVRRLLTSEIRQIARSRTLGSPRLLVTAIGRTLDFPIMNMTEGDYEFFLHWHRINSFKKYRTNINFVCNNTAHITAVVKGEKAEETLNAQDMNPQFVSLTNVSLDEAKLEPLMLAFHEAYGVYPYITRMEDVIEVAETDAAELEGLDMYLEYAGNLSPEVVAAQIAADPKLASHKLRLRAKYILDNEDNFDADFIHMLSEIKENLVHGVEHKVRVTCKECGASSERKLSLDAGSFLP